MRPVSKFLARRVDFARTQATLEVCTKLHMMIVPATDKRNFTLDWFKNLATYCLPDATRRDCLLLSIWYRSKTPPRRNRHSADHTQDFLLASFPDCKD